MKINDIRAGNLVRLKNRIDFYAIVADIYANGGVYLIRKFKDGYSDGQMENVEDLTPILLNAKILADIDFSIVYYDRETARIRNADGSVDFNSDLANRGAIGDGKPRTIETLHDLQNFWYTQTKQELNVEKLTL